MWGLECKDFNTTRVIDDAQLYFNTGAGCCVTAGRPGLPTGCQRPSGLWHHRRPTVTSVSPFHLFTQNQMVKKLGATQLPEAPTEIGTHLCRVGQNLRLLELGARLATTLSGHGVMWTSPIDCKWDRSVIKGCFWTPCALFS